jgi:Tfp pilus assembly protein PilF
MIIRFPYVYVYLLLLTLFAGCSYHPDRVSKMSEAELENHLDSLITVARLLPDDAEQEKLVSLYYEAKQTMDLIPDTSVLKAKAILFTMNKLGKTGGFNEAIKQGWEAINISYKANLDDPSVYRVQAFGTLAELYRIVGNEDSTFIIYKMATIDAAQNPDMVSYASALNNLGIFFSSSGAPDSALVYFSIADSLMKALDEKERSWWIFQGNIRSNIASVYFSQGEYAKARDLYLTNYELCEKNKDSLSLITAGISLAKTEIALGNYRQADSLLRQSQIRLDSASLNNEKKISNQLYLLEVRQDYFEKTGNMAAALAISGQILSFSDSTRRIEQNNRAFTSGLLARYSSSMFTSALKTERLIRNAEKKQAWMVFWIIVLIALGMSITPTILLYYYRQKVRLQDERYKFIESEKLVTKQKLELEHKEKLLLDLELENKKKDLTDMALHLSRKQEWATELQQRIKLIESLRGNKRLREFVALKSEIRNQINVDQERALIFKNIESLNAAFYEKINEKYPSLTPTEMKLFSFIKLKMSNAQIAQLQNINPDSVRMSRLRLRRKLNLEQGQDLDTFIQGF